MKPTPAQLAQIAGAIRAIVPVAIVIGGRHGLDLSWLSDPDVIGGLSAVAMVIWSIYNKRKAAPVKLSLLEPKANP